MRERGDERGQNGSAKGDVSVAVSAVLSAICTLLISSWSGCRSNLTESWCAHIWNVVMGKQAVKFIVQDLSFVGIIQQEK